MQFCYIIEKPKNQLSYMKFYELNCLIRPDYENEIEQISQKIKGILEQNEGKVEHISSSVRLKLGYPIDKYKEAFVVNFFFYCEESKLQEAKKLIEEIPGNLRALYVVADPKQPFSNLETKATQTQREDRRPKAKEEATTGKEETKAEAAAPAPEIKEEIKEEAAPEVKVEEKPVETKHKKKTEIGDLDKQLEKMLGE